MAELLPDALNWLDQQKRAVSQAMADAAANPTEAAMKFLRGMQTGGGQLVDTVAQVIPGNTNPDVTGKIEEALGQGDSIPDTLGQLMGPPIGKLAKLAPAIGAMIAGPRAIGADLGQMARASKYLSKGADADSVMAATGWSPHASGVEPGFEIPDQKAIFSGLADGRYYGKGKVGDFIDHPELFQAYPSLKELPLELKKVSSVDQVGGGFDPKSGSISVSYRDPDEGKTILLHELQHSTDLFEHRMSGGDNDAYARILQLSPTSARNDRMLGNALEDDPHSDLFAKRTGSAPPGWASYAANGGEVNARNVEARAQMDPTQAAQQAFTTTQGVDPSLVLNHADNDPFTYMKALKAVIAKALAGP